MRGPIPLLPLLLTIICVPPGFFSGYAQNVTNLIRNPSFESAGPRPVLWYGTHPDGSLQTPTGSVPVLTEAGSISSTSMPASVAVADMNNDRLPDIVAAGVDGYLYIYFNSGSPKEPKFTIGELIPIYIPRLLTPGLTDTPLGIRAHAPRITLVDPSGSGRHDIWMGTYAGLVLRIPNGGSPAIPAFTQPRDLNQIAIPTSPDNRRWGNVFAPALFDFNGDRNLDLLLGEGSYSANSIHILINQGSSASPRFNNEGSRHILAYGMGREQLTPAVVDYNNDGQPDLLVADRTGQIGLYSSSIAPADAQAKEDNLATAQAGGRLAQGGRWQPGEHLPFVSYIQAGSGTLRVSGIPTVSAADLDGDGLFDLVIGLNTGRIQWAKNTGSPGSPKFAAPQPLKGEPTPPIQGPSGWDADPGNSRGNFFGVIQVVTAQDVPNLNPPEGQRALRMGYIPNKNSVMRTNFPTFARIGQPPRPAQPNQPIPPRITDQSPSNAFFLEQRNIILEVGGRYNLSFQSRGSNVSNIQAALHTHRSVIVKQGRQEQLGRGAVRTVGQETARETLVIPINLRPGPNWTTITTPFEVKFQDKRLNEADASNIRQEFILTIIAEISPPNGELFLDDFKLTKQ